MPFINGRFYMNPAYGQAVENARAAEGTSNQHEPQPHDPNAHWVTLDGRHVLIREAQAGRAPIHEVNHKNRGRRAAIADAARKHDGDTSMPYTPGHPTCNLFVQKAVAESGAPKPVVTMRTVQKALRARRNGRGRPCPAGDSWNRAKHLSPAMSPLTNYQGIRIILATLAL